MSSYQQILAGTSVSITETFSVDGTAINVDSGLPTLTLTRPDGTAYTPVPTVLNSWAGPPARATGEYRFVLPAQPDPYYLDYKLVGTIGGQAQTLRGRVEWIGEYLFNLDAFRKLKVAGSTPFASDTTYPNEDIQQARAETLDEFTEILGFSPVPRFYRQTLSVGYGRQVQLRDQMATKLLSVTVNGVTSATSNYYLDGVDLIPVSGYSTNPWYAYGTGNLVVEYVAGWDRPKGDGSNVAMLRTAMKLNPSMSSTATTVSYPDGSSYTYDPAGQIFQRGNTIRVRHFGVPAIDSWLHRWERAGLGAA